MHMCDVFVDRCSHLFLSRVFTQMNGVLRKEKLQDLEEIRRRIHANQVQQRLAHVSLSFQHLTLSDVTAPEELSNCTNFVISSESGLDSLANGMVNLMTNNLFGRTVALGTHGGERFRLLLFEFVFFLSTKC